MDEKMNEWKLFETGGTDYSEMTDEELNEAIALKQGWLLKTCACGRPGCHDWWMTPDGGVDYNQTAPPDYTHDWRLCGDLLEEMRNKCFVSLMNGRLDNPAWVCSIFLNPAGISTSAPTPKRAICEAWLAWKED